jgi:hypothetical protein
LRSAPVGTYVLQAGACDSGVDRVTIPPLLTLGREMIPQIVEGVLAPLGLFVVALHFAGVWVAMLVALGFSGVMIGRRLMLRRRVPGLMIVGALMLLARSVAALATGSVFIYFVGPVFGAALVATAFLLSIAFGQPLAQRFASDFCTIPSHVFRDVRVHAFFQRCSLMWAIVGIANTIVTLGLLISLPVATFVILKTAFSFAITVAAIGVSAHWFRRSMIRDGFITA